MWIEIGLFLATAFFILPRFLRWVDTRYGRIENREPVEAKNFKLEIKKFPLELAFEKDFAKRKNEH